MRTSKMKKLKLRQNTISLQQEQAAKNRVVNVSLIQNMVQDFKAEDNHIVQVNGKASAADGDVQEKQL
ncbi:hypothetical protein H5410_030453 [Solanum commersonii]|uniref:Uncharacterized protein n=1 Tax=Solanum commersonii TaxID=4109 RepID=A0A9J5YEC1_SOLCO|nr:hypothetical protein H5410_030453 [Solanum commersonii]